MMGDGRRSILREWVGGCVFPPFFVTDRDEPYRPGLVLWLDLLDGLVVANQVVAPEEVQSAVGRALNAALEDPLAGPPRRPDRVRVSEATLVAEVRNVLGEAVPIDVAPTPELDELLESMVESLSAGDDHLSYFEDGRVSHDAVDALFAAAAVLYRIAPWQVATDDRVVRMDIPALDVEGACVSIMGNLGEALGLAIFPSFSGYEAFASTDLPNAPDTRVDFGTEWLVLSLERGADLPSTMRREVAEQHWPVEAPDAYPRVAHHERDGAPRPLAERDVRTAAACASALCAFFAKHPHLFQAEVIEPVCESFVDSEELEVRITVPYEALHLFDVDRSATPAAAPAPKLGRNDSCHCGSGRKYKKCHLETDRRDAARAQRAETWSELDTRLTLDLFQFACKQFGEEWVDAAFDPFFDLEDELQLAIPMAVYHTPFEERSVAEWFLEKRGSELSADEQICLEAERDSWLSIWQVENVRPGEGLALRDRLSGQTWEVTEHTASRSLSPGLAIIARLVDIEGHRAINGMYPRSLPPQVADEVERRARAHLRRKRDIPLERLREPKFCRYLVRRVEEELFDLEAAPVARSLQNRGGEPLLWTEDHFTLAPGERRTVEERLAALPEVVVSVPEGVAVEYLFVGDDDTILGIARVLDAQLRLEANSVERADTLRARVEEACGDRLRHRARAHSDPLSVGRHLDPVSDDPSRPSDAETNDLLRAAKDRHYAEWLDIPVPALDGKAPRAAAASTEGRQRLALLIAEFESHEQILPAEQRYDFGWLRRELGLHR